MTENQGERPEETPAAGPSQNPDVESRQAPAAASQPATPGGAQTPPLPPVPQAAAGWTGQRPAHPGYPQQPYGAAPQQHPYGQAPRAPYAGQHAGQPPIPPTGGQSFGAAAASTQPTLPLSEAEESTPRKKSGAGKITALIVAAALVGGFAGLGGAYVGVGAWGGSQNSPVAAPSAVTVNDTENVNATTGIATKVLPSVVTISASAGSGGGTGSGVVLSEDGYVVTNTHVVTLDGKTADATIRVTTSDGHVYAADLVGTDPTYDLAVIKLVDASGLTPIEFADSSKLNVGDSAVAVGAPLGLSNTVTTGIVSALNRSIEVASSAAPKDDQSSEGGSGESPFFFDYGQGQQGGQAKETIKIAVIQTDAAINPGNSGGALVDGEGKLVGINVAIASAGGSSGQAGSIGVGFAIPSDVAQRVTREIIDNGEATHGLLGATVQSTESLKNPTIAGAYIKSVSDGGAAAGGGLREGDIVTAFNGLPITNSVDLTAQVRAVAAGSEATITYVRDGSSHTTKVTLDSFSG